MSQAAATRNDEQRPLDFAVIRRLYGYTRPFAGLRNRLVFFVVTRAVLTPLVTWSIAAVISGPIARHDLRDTTLGVLGFLALAAVTELGFVYRARYALRLGEAVVHDLRNEIYRHLLSLPMSFFKRTQVGRLIGRVTSDVDAVRLGVQDVAFVSTVQAGNLVVSAAFMLYYDWRLFLVVATMAPILWATIRHFRAKLSQAYRAQQESFSRVTATLAESVNGIREIQGFVRQDVNGGLFGQLIYDHSKYNMGAGLAALRCSCRSWSSTANFPGDSVGRGWLSSAEHEVELKALIQFLFLSNAFFAAIPNLGNQYNQALTAMAGAERVFTLLDVKPDWQDAPDAAELPPIHGRVEFRDVSFSYQPGQRGTV